VADSLRYRQGEKIAGRYLVQHALHGAMGEVYLCIDMNHDHPLALKTFQSRFLQPLRLFNSFNSEVANWIALGTHPNIVRCYYRETVDNQPFMFLEWIKSDLHSGTDLRSLLDLGLPDSKLALDLIIDICRGMDHAAQMCHGIVHRDLKPDNILIGQGGVAKITDFGLAKIVGDTEINITFGGAGGLKSFVSNGRGVVGTPGYMAPEQWLNQEQDARTDIYAIGCIVYEIFAGKPAFHASDVDDFRDLHLKGTIPQLQQGNPLHKKLNTLIERCLAKRKEDRFATASVLQQEMISLYKSQFVDAPRAVAASQGLTGIDYANRGFTYCDLKRFGPALRDHNAAIEADPEEGRFYNNRGITYDALNQFDLALADFTRAIKLDPSNLRAFYNRAVSHIKLKEYEKAIADFNRAIQLDPKYALAYTTRGIAYLKLERCAKALRDHFMAIKIDRTLVPAYINRGTTYIRLERFKDAERDFTFAKQLDPYEPDIYINLGALQALNNNLPEAWGLFEEAAKLGHPQGKILAERAKKEYLSLPHG
jgi:serine/threonine protein kinase